MHGVGTGCPGHGQNGLGVGVRGALGQRAGLVGELGGRAQKILGGVGEDGRAPQIPDGAHHAQGDLTAVGDEDAVECPAGHQKCSSRRAAVRASRGPGWGSGYRTETTRSCVVDGGGIPPLGWIACSYKRIGVNDPLSHGMTPNHHRSIVKISQRRAITLEQGAPASGSVVITRPVCQGRDEAHWVPRNPRGGPHRVTGLIAPVTTDRSLQGPGASPGRGRGGRRHADVLHTGSWDRSRERRSPSRRPPGS